MTVLLAYLGTIQAAALSTDERGRRVGSDVSLDFFASSTVSPTRAMVRSGFFSLMLEIHNWLLSRVSKAQQRVSVQMALGHLNPANLIWHLAWTSTAHPRLLRKILEWYLTMQIDSTARVQIFILQCFISNLRQLCQKTKHNPAEIPILSSCMSFEIVWFLIYIMDATSQAPASCWHWSE